MKTLLHLTLLFTSISSFAQQKEIDEIKKVYAWFSHPVLEVKSTYQAFASPTATVPMEAMESHFYKKDTLQHLVIGPMEMVRGANFGLNINHSSKTIDFQPRSPQVGTSDLTGKIDWSVLVEKCSTITKTAVGPNTSAMTLIFLMGPYKKIILTYDSKTFKPKTVDTYYRIEDKNSKSAHRLVMQYVKFLPNPVIPANTFSSGPFVQKENEKWYCQPQYSAYKLTVN